MPQSEAKTPELIYVGDPMCSWCWGFAPVLDGLAERFTMPIEVIVGGLRPGPAAEPIDDKIAGFLAHHWHQVEERSGQPFNHDILERRDWVYDTELPAKAVVAMRNLNPKQEIAFFARLQRAFYVDNVNVTEIEAYPPLADDFDVDQQRFMELLRSIELKEQTWHDFDRARALGANGFPTLMLRADQVYTLSRGYAPLEPLVGALNNWLRDRFPAEAEGLICQIGEPC